MMLNGGACSSATSMSSGQNNFVNCMAAAVTPSTIGGSVSVHTIEDQIKFIDRIMKECDTSRKSLELINRRLDDLNDEVRRYREFLSHEKSRRDPAIYKTTNVDQQSSYNDNICGTIGTLTHQLSMEWSEKLRVIQTSTLLSKSNEKS